MAHDDDDLIRILQSFIRLEVKKGHLKWKITDLAKSAGVARTSVYYHFGKSREAMIKRAVGVLMTKMMGLDPAETELWTAGKYSEAILFSKKFVDECPEMIQFYFYWKNHPGTEIEGMIQAFEAAYILKLKNTFPQLTNELAQILYSFMQSLVFQNFVTEKHVYLATPLILKLLSQVDKSV